MDLHCYSASLIFGIDYEKFFDKNGKLIDEMKTKYRNPAKSISFGILYGMGVSKLAATLSINLYEARKLMKKYFITFPYIKNLMDDLSEAVEHNRYTYSPLDHRRMDVSHIDWDNKGEVSHAINEAKNMPFQGCGASTTKLALVKISNNIKIHKWDARIVNVVHDTE
jgi:DNA polymerase-1